MSSAVTDGIVGLTREGPSIPALQATAALDTALAQQGIPANVHLPASAGTGAQPIRAASSVGSTSHDSEQTKLPTGEVAQVISQNATSRRTRAGSPGRPPASAA